ncbi:MAG TPA: hypothetical protein VLS90_00375 [Thermodesulfobacteriota bacterium]|nr:hypothetical protein [Thermodesulfobacteriota bacterium]
MGIIDGVNRWLRRRWGRTGPGSVRVSPENLKVVNDSGRETVIPWGSVRQVMAVTLNTHVRPDFFIVFVRWGSGSVTELNEAMHGWAEVPEAFERHLPGSAPSTRWLLELHSNPRGPVRIFEADRDPSFEERP